MSEHAIYPQRESKSLELKLIVPTFDKLIKTCIAFANGGGGKIIIGVEDKTRKILGITDPDRNRIYDEFTNSLYDAVRPLIPIQIYEQSSRQKSILIIEIPYCEKKPYFLQREGLPLGVYVRVGSNTRRVNEAHYEELLREGGRKHYDEETIAASVNILSKERLLDCLGEPLTRHKLRSEKIINHSSSAAHQYQPTVAGVLAFCEMPEHYIPEALILCTRFGDKKEREIIQTQEIKGDLLRQAEASYKLICNWMERDFSLTGVRLKGKLPIPAVALREAIINALIHRKYSIPGAIKIALYDEQLEIFSPGCFPGLVDINHLGDGITYLRNPSLARLARKLGLVEKLGTGIRLIFDSCAKAGIRPPEYFEEGDFVKIIFYFMPLKQAADEDEIAILKLAKFKQEFSIADVMDFLQTSRNTATRKLTPLVKAGKLIRMGKGPAVRYRLD